MADSLDVEVARVKARLDGHEIRHDEFMLRTDKRLDEIVSCLGKLSQESGEWSGIRKALTAIVTLLTLFGAAVGFFLHQFFPHGFMGKP